MYSVFDFEKPFLENAKHGKLEITYTDKSLNEDTVTLAKNYEGIALFTCDSANQEIIDILYSYGIKFISLRSVGHNHIDLKRARTLGIKVANVPEYSPYSVAEHALALLMALNRKIVLGQQLIGMGDYRLDHLVGFDVHGKKVGIVGLGKIGLAFARIMHGFGCEIMAYDPEENHKILQNINISFTSLQDLCKNSDIISVHCPLTKDTNHMFNSVLFNIMKRGVYFINTARGSIVNTKDLIKALDSNIVAGAGLDVYEKENSIFFKNHLEEKIEDPIYIFLQTHPKVLITGHQGFLTQEALTAIAQTTMANLNSWTYNSTCENELE